MAETISSVNASLKSATKKAKDLSDPDHATIVGLVRAARARGDDLTGPDGLLGQITAMVLETALEGGVEEHLGYEKHAVEGRRSGNSRGGARPKTVLTDIAGPVEIMVPRDRNGTFEPVIVAKYQRRLGNVDTIARSLYARGLTTGQISAYFAEIYGASISKDRVSKVTDQVIEEMNAWCSRPLLPVYAAIFIDTSHVKVRDGSVANRAFYTAIGVDLNGNRDVLGIWAGSDGLKGLPDSANTVFPLATIQTCIIHLIRGTFRSASKKDWDRIARELKPIYQAPSAKAAFAAFEEFGTNRARRYPAISGLWRSAWEEFTPFLEYDIEIRKVLCSTNAIESLNSRFRRAARARRHFPSEQSALETLYLVVRSLNPKDTGQRWWVTRWKPALNEFAVTFADRMPTPENL